MKYTLMQKNEAVLDVDMDPYGGDVDAVGSVRCPERLPLSVLHRPAEAPLKRALQEWINYRNIPKTRAMASHVFYGRQASVNSLSLKSLGLNLNDQYWFCPADSGIHWEDVNFFENNFSGHPLGMSFPAEMEGRPAISPDYSSNGNLPKFWFIENDQRFLAKAGARPYFQQPYNEIAASALLQQSGLPHVTYTLKEIEGDIYSVCPTFVTPDTEYVPAYEIWNTLPFDEKTSRYHHFLSCAEALGLTDIQEQTDTILQFDFLINNTDRHLGNFGFIRDVNTLKFLGMAPLFDNGNSLWFDSPSSLITSYHQPACPFAAKQDKQLKLTAPRKPWLAKLSEDFIKETLQETFAPSPLMKEERIEKIIQTVLTLRNELVNFTERKQARE